MGLQFFETSLGQKFVNTTMKHAKGVDDSAKRTADALERIATALEAISAGQADSKELLNNINETLKWNR